MCAATTTSTTTTFRLGLRAQARSVLSVKDDEPTVPSARSGLFSRSMDPVTPNIQDKQDSALWLQVLGSLLAIAAALTLSAGLLAHQQPTWLVVGAGLAAFPFLPLLWHVLGEAGSKGRPMTSSARTRFALRALAVGLVVLGVSLGNLGGKQVLGNLRGLTALVRSKPAKDAVPEIRPVTTAGARHGLESFIPADATMVVGLAGVSAVEQLLAAHGITARAELSALATCQIDFANARILIASRAGAQMIVVRASGIGDERNLYCLVGVLGAGHVQMSSEGSAGAKTLRVSGLLSRALAFRTLDASTVIAIDEAWKDSEGKKLFAADGTTAQGRLGPPLLRLDRGAPLWMASADQTPQGEWDLALDCRQDGALLNLRGSATPPSGAADRAELSLRVPLAFVRTLPEQAVSLGIRGVVAATMAANAAPPPAPPAPPATPPKDAGTR